MWSFASLLPKFTVIKSQKNEIACPKSFPNQPKGNNDEKLTILYLTDIIMHSAEQETRNLCATCTLHVGVSLGYLWIHNYKGNTPMFKALSNYALQPSSLANEIILRYHPWNNYRIKFLRFLLRHIEPFH